MWEIKLTAIFTTAAKRTSGISFLTTRLAPSTGTLAPASRQTLNTWDIDELSPATPQFGFVGIWQYDTPPNLTNVRTLWSQRATWLDSTAGGAGVIACALMIFQLTGATRKRVSWMCFRSLGGALNDAWDTDTRTGLVDGVTNWGGVPV